MQSILHTFHPIVRTWFEKTFGTPSPPQELGWRPISEGKHTLIVAPTGSGKTLAAFLWCINHIIEQKSEEEKNQKNNSVKILYISPLKALNNDIHRNLEIPLEEIHREAIAQKFEIPKIRSAVRTGDTTQSQRQSIQKNPPDILITTPESLYIMLTSKNARKIFGTVQYVIVDEIHSLSNNKRGVHLSLSLERLEAITAMSFIRIGLSATQKPLEIIAQFLGGLERKNNIFEKRNVTIVNAGEKKKLDIRVHCPIQDFSNMPIDSAWTSIFPELLQEIHNHRTTLIFVNNRRLAERVAAKLNELLTQQENTFNNYAVPIQTSPKKIIHNEFLVKAYHSSMSRTEREKMEMELKAGTLRVLVTTSSLELGIDIGSVDLVIQLQSPKGIARGLQRVGRSGHVVNATSKGKIFPTYKDDLLESAVIAKEMQHYNIEPTKIPINCLDVLAQHIVAAVSVEEWDVDDLLFIVQQSYCYSTLTKKTFLHVIEMLAGRYSSEMFRELHPRISYNKITNTLSALPGSSHLALTNAGTIPDTGYFAVYLQDEKTKIGEVDEEFIYESRVGDTFILGSHVWKMKEIDANRVIVEPAPGQPARMPFWRGEGIGRSYELSITVGKFIETVDSHPDKFHYLKTEYPIDANSAWNIAEYIQRQKEATTFLPTHNTIVVEGFRDEIGDPRIVVHSCFGKSINGLLGIVLAHQLKKILGIEIQMLYNDNGILFRCSDVERLPLDIFSSLLNLHNRHAELVSASNSLSSKIPKQVRNDENIFSLVEEAEQIIIDELPSSPIFGALFRYNAARALLLPKAKFGKRTPLWLQRLRSGDLLQIVRQFQDFPIVIETLRDCLNDTLDYEKFKEIFSKIENQEIRIHTIQTEFPSPFASSLLFDFVSVYMYEWDEPKTKEISASTINRELLSDVVALENIHTTLRDDAVTRVEEQLQYSGSTRKARTAEELFEIFLRLGELTTEEILERSENGASFIESLQKSNSIISIMIGKHHYWIATEETSLYLPIANIAEEELQKIPEELRTPQLSRKESLRFLFFRTLSTHGILDENYFCERYSAKENEVKEILEILRKEENIIEGKFNNAEVNQWAYKPNLEKIHNASLFLRRKEIQTVPLSTFTKFLLHWQHRTSQENEIYNVCEQLQGIFLPSQIWHNDIFSPRMKFYSQEMLQTLCSQGEIVCIGTKGGKISWVFRGEENNVISENVELSSSSQKVYEFLQKNGASFFSVIREELEYSLPILTKAISELFWNGFITNDIVEEVLNIKRYKNSAEENILPEERYTLSNPMRNRMKNVAMNSVRKALKNIPGWNGRWSVIHKKNIPVEDQIKKQAEQLLLRYGIVARELVKREEYLLPWSLLAMEFQRMEMRGEIRRGYFVEGLSGMQFAHPEAVKNLYNVSQNTTEKIIILNTCDPANPYGIGIELPKGFPEFFRYTRSPQNYIIFFDGVPIMVVENFGTKIISLQEISKEIFENALQEFLIYLRSYHKTLKAITVEYCNDERPNVSRFSEIFERLGFYREKMQTLRVEL